MRKRVARNVHNKPTRHHKAKKRKHRYDVYRKPEEERREFRK